MEKARAVTPVLRAAAAEIEAERALTPVVLAAMHDAELFRLTLPRRHNGAALPLPVLAQVAEIIAGADASTGWCLGQAFGCAMSAAFMDEAPAEEVFGAKEAVLAWGAGLQGKMVATDGGYLVSGTWRFASGSHHATWLGGHSKVFEADGSPRQGANGRQANRTALFPRERADMADDWHVMGLRGTRSEGDIGRGAAAQGGWAGGGAGPSFGAQAALAGAAAARGAVPGSASTSGEPRDRVPGVIGAPEEAHLSV